MPHGSHQTAHSSYAANKPTLWHQRCAPGAGASHLQEGEGVGAGYSQYAPAGQRRLEDASDRSERIDHLRRGMSGRWLAGVAGLTGPSRRGITKRRDAGRPCGQSQLGALLDAC